MVWAVVLGSPFAKLPSPAPGGFRNTSTSVTIEIPASKSVGFKAGKALKDAVN